jgi:hypothetical protein
MRRGADAAPTRRRRAFCVLRTAAAAAPLGFSIWALGRLTGDAALRCTRGAKRIRGCKQAGGRAGVAVAIALAAGRSDEGRWAGAALGITGLSLNRRAVGGVARLCGTPSERRHARVRIRASTSGRRARPGSPPAHPPRRAVRLFVRWSVRLFVCLFVCLFVGLFVCWFVGSLVCWFVCLIVGESVCS